MKTLVDTFYKTTKKRGKTELQIQKQSRYSFMNLDMRDTNCNGGRAQFLYDNLV